MRNEEQVWLENLYDRLCLKIKAECERTGSGIPYIPEGGAYYDMGKENIAWWTNGFWPGILWQMYTATGEELYKKNAEAVEQRMEQMLEEFVGLDHDAGFLWLLSAVADYRITGNKRSCINALHAANILAGRFNPAGGFIRAWGCEGSSEKSGWMIIDCLMNLPLLYWASEETGDPRFSKIAANHADTAMKAFIRGDGSANHIVEFDPASGEMIKSYGGQGYGEGSSWTRGQSWGLYGFMLSYLHTQNNAYLETAERIANYFIANIPDSGLIPVDFRQPEDVKLEDSTAAAIASCGLIELARQKDGRQQKIYLNAALKMLQALTKNSFNWNEEEDNLLTKCTAAYHDEKHEFSIIYGDYFFLEALMKLTDKELFIW